MDLRHATLVIGLALTLAGCTSSPGAKTATTPSGPRDCFNASAVANYAVADRETVNLRVGSNAYYQIKLLGVCPQIDWTPQVVLSTGGTSTVCTDLDVTILVPTRQGPQECAAESIRRLSSAEIGALSGRARP